MSGRTATPFADAAPGDWIADGTGTPRWQITAVDSGRITYRVGDAEQTERTGLIASMGFLLTKASAPRA